MPFCAKCGAQVDPAASFCRSCGTSLRDISAQIDLSMKEKGASLEDSVASYFRRRGFDVEPRAKMRDRSDVYHEIDVFASKKEDFGTIHVAVECKYVKTATDIREVRNFHDKLDTLRINKGVFVSTGGFTADAEAYANTLGIELWDMTTLRTKLAEQEVSVPRPILKPEVLESKEIRFFKKALCIVTLAVVTGLVGWCCLIGQTALTALFLVIDAIVFFGSLRTLRD
jgi:hypothetical protein